MSELLTLRAEEPCTASSGFAWIPKQILYTNGAAWTPDEMVSATPDNAELLEWAFRPANQPPQSWWDDDSDPFTIS